MKLYWRPGKISNASLVVLALVAVMFMVVIETNKVVVKQEFYEEKIRAVKLASGAAEAIKREVLKHRKALDRFADPAQTGMIGLNLSPITSVVGYLEAKQTSVNPNFAAVVVHMMKRLKLEEGDAVAVGGSGSFPALNLATLAACKALKLKCVMISSLSASMYGANDPRMTWLDMERVAYTEGFIDVRSVAASVGGMDDNGEQLSDQGIELILKAIERNETPLIREGSLVLNIERRLDVYRRAVEGRPYKAYVNVGGNEASIGSHFTKVLFRPGINRKLPRKPIVDEGAMTLMMREFEIPAIHLSNISTIAEKYGLPKAPPSMPALGEGSLFYNLEYNLVLVWIAFLVLLGFTVLVVHFDIGRMLGGISEKKQEESCSN